MNNDAFCGAQRPLVRRQRSLGAAECTCSSLAFAVDEKNQEYNITLGTIQDELLAHLEKTGKKYKVGTETYYNYIVEQLFEHTDNDLYNNPNYNIIHSYMVEYKVAYDDYIFCNEAPDNYKKELVDIIGTSNSCVRYDVIHNEVAFELSPDFLSKTLADIIAENQSKEAADDLSGIASRVSGYSGTQAASYAIQYADSYNSAYPHYSADCTNYVSQCIYWGGINMDGSSVNVGVHETTSDWYCIYINSILGIRRYAVTTSWIRVSDFNTYLGSIASKSTKTTISALVSACEKGDPVQLADKTTGTPYHTIIISGKGTSTAYFCGHTNNRNHEDWAARR